MSRRTGPVRRVRNRRNGDPSALPLPFPQMFVTTVNEVSNSGGVATVYLQILNGADFTVPISGEIRIDDNDWMTINGQVPSLIEALTASISVLQCVFDNVVFIGGEPLEIKQWPLAVRGLEGEWIAPAYHILPNPF